MDNFSSTTNTNKSLKINYRSQLDGSESIKDMSVADQLISSTERQS